MTALRRPIRAQDFALLAGLDACIRGTMISVMPLVAYDTLGGKEATSTAYFHAGLVALVVGMTVPWLCAKVGRRRVYAAGAVLFLVALTLGAMATPWGVTLALPAMSAATVTVFVCLNANILDHVAREDLGRVQSLQMVFAAGPWAVGPMLGVWLHAKWGPAPFVLAGLFAAGLLAGALILTRGQGGGAVAQHPARRSANPMAVIRRFLRQPRLIAGWMFAVTRSCGWWVFVVYLPIFCVESGLGPQVGGIALSMSNALLFIAPLMLRAARRGSVRGAVRGAFALCGAAFVLSGVVAGWPWAAVLAMTAASVCLIFLDVVGGLPFLMAVKPSERAEMSAVYSSFRDVSGILTPGAARLVLTFAPLQGVFVAVGGALLLSALIASRLHPRLGTPRPSRGGG